MNENMNKNANVSAKGKIILGAIFTALAVLLSVWLRTHEVTATRESFSMNIVMRISLTGPASYMDANSQKLLDGSFAIIDRLNRELSIYDPASTISEINSRSGSELFTPVSDDVREIILEAKKLHELTDGVFNPLIGPVTRLWKINQRDNNKIPTQASLDIVLPLCDIANLDINSGGVRLTRSGATLDFGGIAKGYASHLIAKYIQDAQGNSAMTGALIDLGGNIYTLGAQTFNIGVRDPIDPAGVPILVIAARDTAVITSGGYERFKIIDGVKYSHFFDPRTGQPVRNDMLSATLVTPDGTAADALATTFMIMGSERAMEFLRELPDRDPNLARDLGAILIRDANYTNQDLAREPEPEILVTENLRGRVIQAQSREQTIKFF